MITHDLGVIAQNCDEVVVMYAGRIVERAPVVELFANPQHAYTKGLLSSIPRIESERKSHLNTDPWAGRLDSGFCFWLSFLSANGT